MSSRTEIFSHANIPLFRKKIFPGTILWHETGSTLTGGDSELLVDREITHRYAVKLRYIGLRINDKKVPNSLNLIVYAIETRYEGFGIGSKSSEDMSRPIFIRRSLIRNYRGDLESEKL